MLAGAIELSDVWAMRFAELGALLVLIGGLALVGAGVRPSWQRACFVVAGLLLVSGSVLVIIGRHYGPYLYFGPN